MIYHFENYEISDAPNRIDLDAVCAFLSGSYWAAQRSRDTIARTLPLRCASEPTMAVSR